MKIVKVKSSQIQDVGYDSDNATLYIKFIRGNWYSYDNVPGEIYEGLIKAPSVGKYFHKNIKGVFNYRKHKGEEPWSNR